MARATPVTVLSPLVARDRAFIATHTQSIGLRFDCDLFSFGSPFTSALGFRPEANSIENECEHSCVWQRRTVPESTAIDTDSLFVTWGQQACLCVRSTAARRHSRRLLEPTLPYISYFSLSTTRQAGENEENRGRGGECGGTDGCQRRPRDRGGSEEDRGGGGKKGGRRGDRGGRRRTKEERGGDEGRSGWCKV
eukprot:1175730-Prorocentrum_minimum.AAC.5